MECCDTHEDRWVDGSALVVCVNLFIQSESRLADVLTNEDEVKSNETLKSFRIPSSVSAFQPDVWW